MDPKDAPNGGPAFPYEEKNPDGTPYHFNPGMTLRDYFAVKALPTCHLICDEFPDENWRIGVAMDAYAMADAMLAARKGGV